MSVKGQTYLRIIEGWRNKNYQIFTVKTDQYETDRLGKAEKVVKVDYILTSPNGAVEIAKDREFVDFKEDERDNDDIIIAVGSEEYNRRIKKISKLFIKRLFKYGTERR